MGVVSIAISVIRTIVRLIATPLLLLLSPIPILGKISQSIAKLIGINPFTIKPIIKFTPPTIVKDLANTLPLEKIEHPIETVKDLGKQIDSEVENIEKEISIEKQKLKKDTEILEEPVKEIKHILDESIRSFQKVSSYMGIFVNLE
jgi:hypothetical protein